MLALILGNKSTASSIKWQEMAGNLHILTQAIDPNSAWLK